MPAKIRITLRMNFEIVNSIENIILILVDEVIIAF